MKTTALKSLQVHDLEKEVIDLAMNQNAGLAIVKLHKAYGQQSQNADSLALNNELNDIMINARREMKKRITDWVNGEIAFHRYHFDSGYATESIDFTFFDDLERDVTVYVTYSKDDPLRLAGLSIRSTKIFNLEWVIKDEWLCDDLTVLFDAIREAVRLEERNDCEFENF